MIKESIFSRVHFHKGKWTLTGQGGGPLRTPPPQPNPLGERARSTSARYIHCFQAFFKRFLAFVFKNKMTYIPNECFFHQFKKENGAEGAPKIFRARCARAHLLVISTYFLLYILYI